LPLTALIIAGDSASLPLVLGRPAIEVQVRRAIVAGARHVVVLVERMPPSLIAALDRIRREGSTIDIARSVNDAIEFVHPEDRVVLVPPDVLLSPTIMARLVARTAPVLLCVGAGAAWPEFEIVDAATRWTGYAMLDGTTIRATPAADVDWDMASTLLRQLVQARAAPMLLDENEAAAALNPVRRVENAGTVGAQLVAARRAERGGAGRRWLFSPIAPIAARVAGESGIEHRWLAWGGLALTGAAIVGALYGWFAIPLIAILFALFAVATADALVTAVDGGRGKDGAAQIVEAGAAIVVLIGGIVTWTSTGQWGCLVLAAQIVASQAMVKLSTETHAWSADPVAIVALLALGAAVGLPVVFLIIAAIYAAGTLAWCQLVLLRKAQA